jgi:isoamylase
MGGFETMSGVFFAGKKVLLDALLIDCLVARQFTATKNAKLSKVLICVTCHDGFTLNDLVSYDHKHNEANGEDNRDGANDNRSWNCGVEGPTDDPGVEKLRNRQVKNFLTVTMLAVGMPMLLMGDEVRRTQRGNNNPYCQDNETNWFDWTLLAKHADVHRFVTLLNERRVLRDPGPERRRVSLNKLLHGVKLTWPA